MKAQQPDHFPTTGGETQGSGSSDEVEEISTGEREGEELRRPSRQYRELQATRSRHESSDKVKELPPAPSEIE